MKPWIIVPALCAIVVACKSNANDSSVDQTRTTSTIVVEPAIDDPNVKVPTNGTTNNVSTPDDLVRDGGSINTGETIDTENVRRDRYGESFETSGGTSGLGAPAQRKVPGQSNFDTK